MASAEAKKGETRTHAAVHACQMVIPSIRQHVPEGSALAGIHGE